jgi:hypothetical protein
VWLERDGALLRVRLARPKANIIDAAMIAALAQAFAAHRDNAGLLAALVDHEGPHFSFGASVEEHLPGSCEQMLASLHALLGAMLEWPRPILMAIRGQCLGGGLFALAGCLVAGALTRSSASGDGWRLCAGGSVPAAARQPGAGGGPLVRALIDGGSLGRGAGQQSPRTLPRRRTSTSTSPARAPPRSRSRCARRASPSPTSRAHGLPTWKRCTSKN